jgi:hypothetical protein
MTRRALAGAVCGLVLIACGSGTTPTGPGPGGTTGAMTAKVDGQSWASPLLNTSVATVATAPGQYVMTGLQTSGGTAQAITLTLLGVPGVGTYPLGVGSGVSGGNGVYAQGNAGWITSLSGDQGTITLTTLSATRIAGTFSFVADLASGVGTGVKTITNGSFDLPITTAVSSGAVANNMQNRISATLNGTSYKAASVATTSNAASLSGFASVTSKWGVLVFVSGLMAVGTYPLGTTGGVTVSMGVNGECTPGSGTLNCSWNGTLPGATGSVTITSVTGNRATGTFSGTLPRNGSAGAATMVVSNGTFDIGW